MPVPFSLRLIAVVALMAAGLVLPERPAIAEASECPELARLSTSIQAKFLRETESRDLACRTAKFFMFNAKPAAEILDAEGLEAYSTALGDADCDAAVALLINAFDAAYPELPSIVEDPENLKIWRAYVYWRAYPHPTFCEAQRDVRAGRQGLEELGLEVGRVRSLFNQRYRPPRPLLLRNSGVARLALLLTTDFAPAYLALAHLSEDGDVLRFAPEDQYYLLKRAERLGLKADLLGRLLETAAQRLTPDQRAAVERRVDRPVLPVNGVLRLEE